MQQWFPTKAQAVVHLRAQGYHAVNTEQTVWVDGPVFATIDEIHDGNGFVAEWVAPRFQSPYSESD